MTSPATPTKIGVGLGLSLFVLELSTSIHPDYGYFLDELYYIACAKRPALGYVDHPPLAPWLLAAVIGVFGESIPAIRVLPALAGAVTVWLTVRLTARLGGGTFAQLAAGVAVVTAPVPFLLFGLYTMNAFEILLWTAVLYGLVRVSEGEGASAWPWIGFGLGLAVLNKHTALLLAAAIGVAVIASPMRGELRSRGIYLAAAISIAIALPNLLWQVANDFPSLDFYANVDREASVDTGVLGVLLGQIEGFNPGNVPLWGAGLYFLLVAGSGRRYRTLGLIAGILFLSLLFAGKSRPDRIMGIYPLLFAAGALQIESISGGRIARRARYALPALATLVLIATVPATAPLLSPEAAARYRETIDDDTEVQREVGHARLMLPLAHRMGSEELVERVEAVLRTLSPDEREHALILASGYAPAAALEVLGGVDRRRIFSPHNGYWLWGPPPDEGGLVVIVGYEPEQLAHVFEQVDVVDRAPCEYCMGWRQNTPIAIGRGQRESWPALWPGLRRYGYSARKHHLLEQTGQI